MTKQTGSETSATDPAVRSQDSAEPSELPPPSPKACLEILLMPDNKAKRFLWIDWKQALKSLFNG
jgi:hypothetical protein